MNVTEGGVAVPDVIEAVKQAIKTANVSAADQGRDLRVAQVRVILHAVAVRSAGGGLNFRIPVIGMELRVGARLAASETHQIEITLIPPPGQGREQVRDLSLDDTLVDAIETIRAAVEGAAGGDDPFVLGDAAVTISFAVTKSGNISIGVNGSLSQELTHTLILTLVSA